MTTRFRLALLSLLALALLLPGSALASGQGSTQLVSRPDGSGPPPNAFDNNSDTPGALSDDGRYAVFTSNADGFAPGGNPAVENVFLRDTQTATTTLVSRSDGMDGAGANESSSDPDVTVTPTGHVLVAFTTTASNLSDHATGAVTPPKSVNEVWLRDVTAGTTVLVSRTGANGAPGDQESREPSVGVTAGGPVVAFGSSARNLGATVRNGGVYIRTVDAHTTALVSCMGKVCGATPHADDSSRPDLRVVPTADASLCPAVLHPTGSCVLIAFETIDQTISGDPVRQIVVAATTAPAASGTPVSAPTSFITATRRLDGKFADRFSQVAKLSSDGLAVAFESAATNLTADQVPPDVTQLYVKRFTNGSFELLSKASAPEDTGVRSLSLGGDVNHLRAAWETTAANLGGNGDQAYLRDVPKGTTKLLNRTPGADGTAGDGNSFEPTLSADGSAALFTAFSTNLGDDPGEFGRVRVRRLDAPGEPVEIVSRPSGTDPLPSSARSSFLNGSASASADGRFVVFNSATNDLAGDDNDSVRNVYVRDLVTNRTVLVSRASGANGAAADGDSRSAGISADGRKVAFDSRAGNLGGGAPADQTSVYVRDLDAGTTTLVSRADGADGAAAKTRAFAGPISADGNSVVLFTAAPLDPAGADGQFHMYVRNLATGSTVLADRDSGAAGTVPAVGSFDAAINVDGTRVAWTSTAAIAGAPADDKDHVFLRDLVTRKTLLVSRAEGVDGVPADGDSEAPAIDAAGDVVAFDTDAPNLGAGPNATQVVARTVESGHNEVVSVPPADGSAPFKFAEFPSIDAAGDRISFSAFDPGVPAPRVHEVFVRDVPSQTTELVSRADGVDGVPGDSDDAEISSITPSGDCVAFDGRFTNLGDGFASRDFGAVHMRALRGACPRPGRGDPPPPPPPPPPGPPVLSKLKASPARFRVAGRRHGTTISYRLSRGARVTLRFDRIVKGQRRRAGTLTLRGRAGANKVRFGGKLNGRQIRLGRYRLTATPTSGRGHSVRVTAVR
jgi:Tol biopolymer transport system component